MTRIRGAARGGRRLWTPPAPTIQAPTGPYSAGTQVGVPTGTSLTARSSGLGSETGVENLILTHPITGQQATREVAVWRHIDWTGLVSVNVGPGAQYLLDECRVTNSLDNFCVDVNQTNGRADIMAPLVVLRRCTLVGSDSLAACVVGGFVWLIDCDLGGAENGVSGVYWSVITGCNVVATRKNAESHSDALQMSGIGHSLIYRNWLDAGRDSQVANAALRVGTEDAAVVDVDVRYNGFAGTQHGAQFRGDAGPGDISSVTFIGNRWVDEQVHGPTDFQQVTSLTWTDNRFFGGAAIPSPI